MSTRTALVMGGGAGTGRATVMAFGAAGYRVVIADLNSEGGEKSLEALRQAGGEGLYLPADMASAADIDAVMEATRQNFGGLHAVSNNAAAATPNLPFTDIGEDQWDRCMAVTLKGVWLAMKAELALIEASGGGAIVNIASVSGLRGETFQSVYAAAKAGVINLAKSAAAEYARRGVRINTVCPGGINTRGMAAYLDTMPEMRDRVVNVHAMGRLAEPGEVADAVVYLCSEQASFITGQELVVDGGVLVRSNVIDL